jgi:hypothetical protein
MIARTAFAFHFIRLAPTHIQPHRLIDNLGLSPNSSQKCGNAHKALDFNMILHM